MAPSRPRGHDHHVWGPSPVSTPPFAGYHRGMRRTSPFAVLLLAPAMACGPAGDDDPPGDRPGADEAVESIDPSPGGSADSAGLVQEGALGGSYEDHVEPFPHGRELSAENLRGHMFVVRFEAEAGQTLAAIMRAEAGDLDPYLLLKDPGYETVVDASDQAVLPMAPEQAAVVVHTAASDGTHYLFASGEHLASGGDSRVDLLALETTPGVSLSVTNPELRAYADELRELDPDLSEGLSAGSLRERFDGQVEIDPEGVMDVPLRERADLNRLVAEVNGFRTDLFGAFHRAADAPENEESTAAVAGACADLWSAVRAL